MIYAAAAGWYAVGAIAGALVLKYDGDPFLALVATTLGSLGLAIVMFRLATE